MNLLNLRFAMKNLLVLFSLLAATAAHAATPEQLDALLKAGSKVTVIDLRSTEEYQISHIAGSINIPHQLVAEKRLPPIGRVVVYCDGLGSTYAPECAGALNTKPGIQAEVLEGGYAAWRTFTNVTADSKPVSLEQARTITYEELKATKGEGVVLVDVRKGQQAAASGKPRLNLAAFRQQSLPGSTTLTDPAAQLRNLKGRGKGFKRAPSLYVVIDDDYQSAIKTAERIKGMGYQRVVVLAGGEEIIRREGRTGMGRQGGATPFTFDPELAPQPVQPK